ncbi:sam-binding motif containing protein [Grosmannia clavigera kw1407]|uniref:Sam-binding motif containing protein n=1 Tax=Grosmannia clavigera (strain kw1407 / UAMH 11150) TaxID=655863 RepID=F0XP05_GROCL|nr:sam-binding motif containing protein [Grosmannia clavigera kw1407]EFX00467.1 sam-binding motif containing protein [Grosmannia clavigera kw1407]
MSSETPSSAGGVASSQSLLPTSYAKPFVMRNGRTYLSNPSLSYPLPVDLAELHRQSLRTLVLFQLFGGPVCSPALANKPPTRVLEVGCGSGFWSTMCNEYYSRQGHRGISFSGMDIAPVGLGASSAAGKSRSSYMSSSSRGTSGSADGKPAPSKSEDHMNWRFVQHDMRRMPWPFPNEEFDFIMVKDLSLAMRIDMYQLVIDECIRLLQPGGTLELWDSDHTIRMLRPHVPETSPTPSGEEDSHDAAISAGAYIMTPHTPLSAPLNNYLLRLAVPLSELKWEREGVGGVVTKDGKIYVETKGKARDAHPNRKTITAAQSALRRTALLTVVQMIQSLEPILREVSGKSQDEWDGWSGKMVNELMKENGTAWGECLEIGAWWAQKR